MFQQIYRTVVYASSISALSLSIALAARHAEGQSEALSEKHQYFPCTFPASAFPDLQSDIKVNGDPIKCGIPLFYIAAPEGVTWHSDSATAILQKVCSGEASQTDLEALSQSYNQGPVMVWNGSVAFSDTPSVPQSFTQSGSPKQGLVPGPIGQRGQNAPVSGSDWQALKNLLNKRCGTAGCSSQEDIQEGVVGRTFSPGFLGQGCTFDAQSGSLPFAVANLFIGELSSCVSRDWLATSDRCLNGWEFKSKTGQSCRTLLCDAGEGFPCQQPKLHRCTVQSATELSCVLEGNEGAQSQVFQGPWACKSGAAGYEDCQPIQCAEPHDLGKRAPAAQESSAGNRTSVHFRSTATTKR
jgi:hypothetical protein